MPSKNKSKDNTLPVVTHLLSLFVFLIGPLVVLLVSEDDETRKHAKLALNWNFSVIIYGLVGLVLSLVFIGFFVLIAIYAMHFVFSIIAAVKAGEGELWSYPLGIPFFKVNID